MDNGSEPGRGDSKCIVEVPFLIQGCLLQEITADVDKAVMA